MGLGANEDGHWSGCEKYHLRPWHTQCMVYKKGIENCTEMHIDTSNDGPIFYVNIVRRAKDLPAAKVLKRAWSVISKS